MRLMARRGRHGRSLLGCAAAGAVLLAAVCGAGPASAAAPGSTTSATPATSGGATASPGASGAPRPGDILTAPTLVAHTRYGDVGYREIGQGSPLLLIMGHGASMDAWAPDFVDALADRHTVVVFDNAGIGRTSELSAPLTVPAMADQTSALIRTLRLHRPAVLGWSLGGMVAQALAVRHPGQVSRLVLAATQAGTGTSLPVPPAAEAALNSPDPAVVLSVLFPADQLTAARGYAQSILRYPGYYGASSAVKSEQTSAAARWMAGEDPAGRLLRRIHVPTLVADGEQDALDPASNDVLLTHGIRRARLVLYPDAGHAFLFQDTASFVPTVQRFLS